MVFSVPRVSSELLPSRHKNVTSRLRLTGKSPVIIPGVILYTSVGSYGYAALVKEDYQFSFQRHIAYILPNTEKVFPEYLAWWLNSTECRRYADTVALGNAQKTVTLGELSRFPVPLPKYEKQKRIAIILETHDYRIRMEETYLEKLKLQKKGPTKRHWKSNSKIEDIKSGLVALVAEVKKLGITSIAIPPLGCGNGGLNWLEVKPLIESAFAQLPDVQVMIFEPSGPQAAEKMQIATKKPNMTRGRALIIGLMEAYSVFDYDLTKLEIQKLAYFLQESGELLKLRYQKHLYGPYADNLNQVLKHIEGHYISGYGDGTGRASIGVLPEGREAAETFLATEADAHEHLERVSKLIYGFETPYGMEILATVHWVATKYSNPAKNSEDAIALVHEWSERKSKLFKPEQIRKAWGRLEEQLWLPIH